MTPLEVANSLLASDTEDRRKKQREAVEKWQKENGMTQPYTEEELMDKKTPEEGLEESLKEIATFPPHTKQEFLSNGKPNIWFNKKDKV